MNEDFKKSLDAIYKFMAEAYEGNWKYRMGDTPYFKAATNGRAESILSHSWSTIGFWYHLQRICPALASLVNSREVYEILWAHDLGETRDGDVSYYRQIHGDGANKHQIEYEVISEMSQSLSKDTQDQLLAWAREFDGNPEEIKKLEVLVARLVDALQGNHSVFTYGNDLSDYSEPITKIVRKNTAPYVHRLLELLEENGGKNAMEEVRQVVEHHANLARSTGLKLELSDFGL